MKVIAKSLIIGTLVVGFSSCGGKEEVVEEKSIEGKLQDNPLAALKDIAETMEDVAENLNENEGGEPIHHTDLQNYLPKTIEGYEMEDPEGTTLSMQGFSVSSAESEYTAANGDYIKVSILDYFAAMSLYQMATAMWGMGIVIDSDDEYAKSFSLENNVSGWETFDKKNNKASVVAGVGDRLLITVEGNNQTDVEKVKSVLTSMNLKSMSMITLRQK